MSLCVPFFKPSWQQIQIPTYNRKFPPHPGRQEKEQQTKNVIIFLLHNLPYNVLTRIPNTKQHIKSFILWTSEPTHDIMLPASQLSASHSFSGQYWGLVLIENLLTFIFSSFSFFCVCVFIGTTSKRRLSVDVCFQRKLNKFSFIFLFVYFSGCLINVIRVIYSVPSEI